MQPRTTWFLCLKRSLLLRNSRLSSERLRQQTVLSSTYFRCFQIPSSGFNSVAYSGNWLPRTATAVTVRWGNCYKMLCKRKRSIKKGAS